VALTGVHSHFENQAVLVTIDKYPFDFMKVAALFALFPQLPARSAKIGRKARLKGMLQCLAVHVCDHEDLAGLGVLGNGGYQAILVESWGKFQTFFNVRVCSHLFDSF
jgi:hypothetical protein